MLNCLKTNIKITVGFFYSKLECSAVSKMLKSVRVGGTIFLHINIATVKYSTDGLAANN